MDHILFTLLSTWYLYRLLFPAISPFCAIMLLKSALKKICALGSEAYITMSDQGGTVTIGPSAKITLGHLTTLLLATDQSHLTMGESSALLIPVVDNFCFMHGPVVVPQYTLFNCTSSVAALPTGLVCYQHWAFHWQGSKVLSIFRRLFASHRHSSDTHPYTRHSSLCLRTSRLCFTLKT